MTKAQVIGELAQLLGKALNMDFTEEREYEWLCQAVEEFGHKGMMYRNSKAASNYRRYQIWLLHITARVHVKWLEITEPDTVDITKWTYHEEVKTLMEGIKYAEKLN